MEIEIIEIEEAVRKAQLSGGTEFFERVLADDFKFITPQGKIVTKREDIDQYKSGHLRMSKVEVAERTINLFGETAIVRFKVKFEGMAGSYSFSMNMIFTRVYAKPKGTWQMVAGHSSEIQE